MPLQKRPHKGNPGCVGPKLSDAIAKRSSGEVVPRWLKAVGVLATRIRNHQINCKSDRWFFMYLRVLKLAVRALQVLRFIFSGGFESYLNMSLLFQQ